MQIRQSEMTCGIQGGGQEMAMIVDRSQKFDNDKEAEF